MISSSLAYYYLDFSIIVDFLDIWRTWKENMEENKNQCFYTYVPISLFQTGDNIGLFLQISVVKH